ncbi:PQQ-binding-like beta-propeller repeat protein [Erythrobacter arachoides]|uniref:PQQ-binding-like beta-propeller repeat protein n=1 Tax=Aurantiacibacter arachoides TaxID=1850444 RepID=A0A845A3G2_9SPHN|nr:PQQ-binding-like beta-propeller repeat protein [Aurantiacibacter arachoides]MXO93676.1 PQQ-binding-like beta-propeller repeat protein [Aurantiacibacter arachoides]GGD47526.1 quinate/shikimate dehydrogenase [Aurantiacibacter arachoides]
MTTSNLRRALATAIGPAFCLALSACATVPGMDHAGVAAAPGDTFDFETWDGYLGGGDSSQYSSLDQVNRANVSQLEIAWEYPTGDGAPPLFNPTVAGGRMYVVNGTGQLVALDPASGRQLWVSTMEGRIGTRGINYWTDGAGDERLMVLNNGMLRAVNAATGEVIPTFGTAGGVDLRAALADDVTPANAPLQTNNPGRVYRDTIIMSLPAGAYDYASAPADIQAYDIRTGALKWVFHTIPRAGEPGYETWPANEHELVGGGHNWSESTVDTELGIVFIPTGTARYDFYGGNRVGDNLYTDSLVALNAETGERIWHFQTVHHDLWDFDLPVAPKLMTITRDGEEIPIVIQATKWGYLFVFDRRDGTPIWPIVETPVPQSDVPGEVTSPTQPIPSWPEPFARQTFTVDDINPYLPESDQAALRERFATYRHGDGPFIPPSVQGTISFPGHNGGANWGTVAVDPATQRLYVVSRNLPLSLRIQADTRASALEAMPNAAEPDLPYRWPVDFMLQSNGMVAIEPPFSTITAYDMNTGNKLFETPNGEIMTLEAQGITGVGAQTPRSGPVVTGGGLLFVNTASDRAIRARNSETGEVLWEHRFDAGTEGVPAIYEVGGRQYITVPVGGVGHFLGGLGLPEPGPSRYVTFALPR